MYSLGNYPNLVILPLIPKIALAPLFVVWLGISSESRVAFAAFVSFFPVVISAAVGFSNIEASADIRQIRGRFEARIALLSGLSNGQ